MPDHSHLFLGLNPKNAISDLVKNIKVPSNDFINEKDWLRGRFHWQEGYGAFSYSHSQIDDVVKYIPNQESHHKRISFKDEYNKMLKAFNIKYKDGYLFKYFDGLKY
jgi:putative transposase